MKKIIFFLMTIVAICFVQSAEAQTAPHSNRSDFHIPPCVKHYLATHPDQRKKLIHYVKTHGHLPPVPGPGVEPATVAPAQVASLSLPVQSTAGTKLNWPKTPAAPAMPAVSGF